VVALLSSAEPHYRVASAADHHVVVGLLRELVLELGPTDAVGRVVALLDDDIRAALASPNVRIVLGLVGDEVVALGRADVLTSDPIFRLRDDHRCGYIDQMYVKPGHRDRGMGAELMRQCEDWFRSQGIAHSLLHAAPKALRFYARQGYLPNREMFKRL
jgi:GNAT superfamily N-acetyltransferase